MKIRPMMNKIKTKAAAVHKLDSVDSLQYPDIVVYVIVPLATDTIILDGFEPGKKFAYAHDASSHDLVANILKFSPGGSSAVKVIQGVCGNTDCCSRQEGCDETRNPSAKDALSRMPLMVGKGAVNTLVIGVRKRFPSTPRTVQQQTLDFKMC